MNIAFAALLPEIIGLGSAITAIIWSFHTQYAIKNFIRASDKFVSSPHLHEISRSMNKLREEIEAGLHVDMDGDLEIFDKIIMALKTEEEIIDDTVNAIDEITGALERTRSARAEKRVADKRQDIKTSIMMRKEHIANILNDISEIKRMIAKGETQIDGE